MVAAGELTKARSTQKLLSDALGYDVDLKPRRRTKREALEHQRVQLKERYLARINKGRTRGAGAGGFNRDIENIVHQIRLVESEIKCLDEP